MKTELIMVGKTVDKLYTKGISDYQERIGHYMPFNITVIPALKNTKSLSEDQQKQAEGELICALSSRRTRWFCSTSMVPSARVWKWLRG